MGWASGSEIAQRVWDAVAPFVHAQYMPELALELAHIFRAADCDTMGECAFVREYLRYDDKTNGYKLKRRRKK